MTKDWPKWLKWSCFMICTLFVFADLIYFLDALKSEQAMVMRDHAVVGRMSMLGLFLLSELWGRRQGLMRYASETSWASYVVWGCFVIVLDYI
jgi:hypothetical protein